MPGVASRRGRTLFRWCSPLAHAAVVSSADRTPVAAPTAAGFRTAVRPVGAPLGRAGADDAAAPLSLDANAPALCWAIPRGSSPARSELAAGRCDEGPEPLLDRPKLDGRRRKVISCRSYRR